VKTCQSPRPSSVSQEPEAPPIPGYRGLSAHEILARSVLQDFADRIALVSSFGAESAVLLHMVSQIAPDLPVLFLDTRKHFGETLRYRDELTRRLGLTNVQSIRPFDADILRQDEDELLFQSDPDRCCYLRRVKPLEIALKPYKAWITGRKRFQTTLRATLLPSEIDGVRVKINPLYDWTAKTLEDYMQANELPRHPLVADGFLSIGCMPCTARAAPGGNARSGRWSGLSKIECGIHGVPAPIEHLSK
jgi:phosphoadenosine phosphosulfate reductase